jgi:hypothetical protein
VDQAADKGREAMPPRVRFTTYTLRYPGAWWVEIEGMKKHWERASVEAELSERNRVKVVTANVTSLRLDLDHWLLSGLGNETLPVEIDGQNLRAFTVPVQGGAWCELRESGNHWKALDWNGWLDETAKSKTTLSKRAGLPGLTGPIDDAFMDSFIMVAPSGRALNAALGRWTTNEMANAVTEWRNQFRGDAPLRRDDEVKDADIAANNLVLWGDPQSNKLLARMANKLPIHWDAQAVRVGKKHFDSSHHVAVLIYPNPLSPARYVVLNSGFTFSHPRSTSNADQTPKLPDYAVVDIDGPRAVGVNGKVVVAGFFDEAWRLSE